jgi:general secretion pathway protein D
MNRPSPALATTGFALLFSAGLLVAVLAGCCTHPPAAQKNTFSSFDPPTHGSAKPDIPAGMLDFQNADLRQVLAIYQELSRRTVIRPATLPAPTITVRSQTPLTRVQALQLLDTVLAENGIAMVLCGDTAVKAVPQVVAVTESPPEINLPWQELPDSGSFMMRTVHLKHLKAVELVPVLMPFAKTPNALLPISSSNQLIIRDYSSNVRRMLQVIEELEKDTKP